jgi:hypothetical protein
MKTKTWVGGQYKMELREIGWCGMLWYGRDWLNLVQDRDQWRALVNTVINLWVP